MKMCELNEQKRLKNFNNRYFVNDYNIEYFN